MTEEFPDAKKNAPITPEKGASAEAEKKDVTPDSKDPVDAPKKESSADSVKNPETPKKESKIFLDLSDKKKMEQFRRINTLSDLSEYLAKAKEDVLSKPRIEAFDTAIFAIQELDTNIEVAKAKLQNNTIDFDNDGNFFENINIVSQYNEDLSRKIKQILIEDGFTARYLALKFSPKKEASSLWLSNLKKQLSSFNKELEFLKTKNDPKFTSRIKHLEAEIAKTSDFVNLSTQMESSGKEFSEEEFKKQIPKLINIAKEIQKIRGENIDLKNFIDNDFKESLNQEINILLENKYYAEDEEEDFSEDSSSFEDEEKTSYNKINFPSLKAFHKKLRAPGTDLLFMKKTNLNKVIGELEYFFGARPEEKENFPKLHKFLEILLEIKKSSDKEESETASVDPVTATAAETTPATSEAAPKKKINWFENNIWNPAKDSFLSLLYAGGANMLWRMIQMPVDFIFFFSEPRLTEKGFNWKGVDKIILGENSKGKK